MAKIIKRICFMIIVLLAVLTIKVYANEIVIECPDSLDPETEDTIEYVIKGNLTNNINSVKVRYIIPEGVELQGFTPSGDWILQENESGVSKGFIIRLDEGNVTGNIEFGKLILKVQEGYDKKSIKMNFYGFDATNTDCAMIDFENDSLEKTVLYGEQGENQDENQGESQGESLGENQGQNQGENQGENQGAVISQGTSNEKNSLGNSEKSIVQNDDSVAKEPFGQYGGKRIIAVLVGIVMIVIFISRKKLKKLKYIK